MFLHHSAERVRHRLEMPAAAFLDVALIVAQGELSPAAATVMTGDVAV